MDFRLNSGTGYIKFTGTPGISITSPTGTRYVNGVESSNVPNVEEWYFITITGITIDCSTIVIAASFQHGED